MASAKECCHKIYNKIKKKNCFLYFFNNTKKEKEPMDKIKKQPTDNKERKRNLLFTIK